MRTAEPTRASRPLPWPARAGFLLSRFRPLNPNLRNTQPGRPFRHDSIVARAHKNTSPGYGMAVYCGNHRPRKGEQFLNAFTQDRYKFLHIIGAAFEKPREVDTRRERAASACENDSSWSARAKFVECFTECHHQLEVHRLNLPVFYSKHADCTFTFDMNHDLSEPFSSDTTSVVVVHEIVLTDR